MSEPLFDQIEAALAAHFEKVDDAIEEMCERMLVTPDSPGVLVTFRGSVRTDMAVGDDGPQWVFEFPEFTVELHPDVPFGEVYHRQLRS